MQFYVVMYIVRSLSHMKVGSLSSSISGNAPTTLQTPWSVLTGCECRSIFSTKSPCWLSRFCTTLCRGALDHSTE